MKENKKVGIVVLARLNSSRLPGKALMEINGKKVIEYIVERLLQVVDKEDIVLATSNEQSDDALAEHVSSIGIKTYRGSLNNVARRYYEAAKAQKWDYAIRINGDNIFVDIPLLKTVVELSKSGKYSFISNVKDRTFPKGMSIESVELNHYSEVLPKIEASEYYQEHVTLYLYEIAERKNYHFIYNDKFPEAAGLQMALDTREDFERTQELINRFQSFHYYYNLAEIFQLIQTKK